MTETGCSPEAEFPLAVWPVGGFGMVVSAGAAEAPHSPLDGWMDGWMDGWVGGWMDGWMDGWTDVSSLRRAATTEQDPTVARWSRRDSHEPRRMRRPCHEARAFGVEPRAEALTAWQWRECIGKLRCGPGDLRLASTLLEQRQGPRASPSPL